MAEAGLRDARRVDAPALGGQIRWALSRVALDWNALYIDEGDILTSAGTAAAINCCLHVVRKDHVAEIANRIARRQVVAPHRHGGQAQYIEKPVPHAADADRLDATISWPVAHPDEPLSVERLADHASMSLRTFTRHLRKRTGDTLTQWMLSHHLTTAQRLLETNSLPIDPSGA